MRRWVLEDRVVDTGVQRYAGQQFIAIQNLLKAQRPLPAASGRPHKFAGSPVRHLDRSLEQARDIFIFHNREERSESTVEHCQLKMHKSGKRWKHQDFNVNPRIPRQ